MSFHPEEFFFQALELYPVQQGLKRFCWYSGFNPCCTGLKRICAVIKLDQLNALELYPVQQGLKPEYGFSEDSPNFCS